MKMYLKNLLNISIVSIFVGNVEGLIDNIVFYNHDKTENVVILFSIIILYFILNFRFYIKLIDKKTGNDISKTKKFFRDLIIGLYTTTPLIIHALLYKISDNEFGATGMEYVYLYLMLGLSFYLAHSVSKEYGSNQNFIDRKLNIIIKEK